MTWDGNGRALQGVCKPSCCKTPLGHSGAAPAWCACHPAPPTERVVTVTRDDVARIRREVFGDFDGGDAA